MKKVLEIGGGLTPYFIRYQIPIEGTEEYVSVDISDENTQKALDKIKEYKEQGHALPVKVASLVGDACNLEFPNETFDEVVLSNTLSAPIHWNWDKNGNFLKVKRKDGVYERPILTNKEESDPFYIERKNLIEEAKRVLKPGGRISVYTDLVIYGLDSYQRIIEELKGFAGVGYVEDNVEALRIDEVNKEKLKSPEYCCCFRAEVLPKSEVYRFMKI